MGEKELLIIARYLSVSSKHLGFNFQCSYGPRFGVCCIFLVSATGSTISQNCSYIRNPGYPSAYTSTSSVSYTINKCSPGESYNCN